MLSVRRVTVPVEVDRDSARDAARTELSRPIYADAEPGLLERVMLWVLDRVQQAIDAIADGARALAPGGAGSLILLAALLFVAAVLIRLRVGRVARVTGIPRDALVDSRVPSREYRSRAEDAAAAGDYDAAVHERFRALIRVLEERGVIDDAAGQTATEIAARAAAELAGPPTELFEAARIFDDVYYGHHAADARRYSAIAATDDRIQSARLVAPEERR